MGLNFQVIHYYGSKDGPKSLINKHVIEVGPTYDGIDIMKVIRIRNIAFLIHIPRAFHRFFVARLFNEYTEELFIDESSLTIDEDDRY